MEGKVPFRLAVLVVAAVQGGVSIYYVTKSGATSTIFHRREESVVLTVPLVTSYPMYTAFLMQIVGIGLLIANWFAGVAGLATWGLLAVRTGREEQKLIERFACQDPSLGWQRH